MTAFLPRGLSRAAAPAALGAAAGVIAACAGSAPVSPRAQALAYMQSHPVPFAPGMTAAVVLADNTKEFAGAAADEAGCPASLDAYTAGLMGSLPACGAWVLTVETPAGRTVTVSCGSIPARQACPVWLTGNGSTYVPYPGDYVLFASDGQVVSAGGIRLVTYDAVDAIAAAAPDDEDPFVTTPAGGS